LLEATAKKADEDYVDNKGYELGPKGVLVLKRRKAPDVPSEVHDLKHEESFHWPMHKALQNLDLP
jgi:hypothetical protein